MYCTHAEVSALTGFPYDANTSPTVTDINGLISDASAAVDLALKNNGVITPVDESAEPTLYAYAKNMTRTHVAAQATMDDGRSDMFWARYKDMAEFLETEDVVLSDEQIAGEAAYKNWE